jgi:predicted phosphodiesterase
MRLAVLSDIHGNLTAFDAALADYEAVGEGVDMTWILGDLAAFGPRPSECIRRVRELEEKLGEKKIRVIGGNTDRYLVTGERFKAPPAKDEEGFRKLPGIRSTIDLMVNWGLTQITWEDYEYLAKILGKETHLNAKDYGHVIGYHAVPGDDEAMLTPTTPEDQVLDSLLDREGRLAVGGHIHVQMDRDLGSWRVINVGSVGLSFDMPGRAQWGLFTFEGGNVAVDLRAVPYDAEAAIAELDAVKHPAPGWVSKRIREGA